MLPCGDFLSDSTHENVGFCITDTDIHRLRFLLLSVKPTGRCFFGARKIGDAFEERPIHAEVVFEQEVNRWGIGLATSIFMLEFCSYLRFGTR